MNEVVQLIIEKVDPEELIDVLGLDIEYLTNRLKVEVLEAIEEGDFDYVLEGE